jgi:hypothetical protein
LHLNSLATASAAWEDARVGLRYLRLFDGCAIVGDVAWIRDASRLAGLFMPCPVRTFPNAERANAVAWLDSLKPRAGLSFRLLQDTGVLIIEITAALRREDFDGLSAVVDGWLEAHGELRGVVVHASEFPGWKDLAGFLRHVRFVRDHHRKVRKVALAVGGGLAELAPRIAEHFIQAEVKHFDYAAFDEAIAWAGTVGR